MKKEVDYRLAKWMIKRMKEENILTDAETKQILKKVAEYYNPPFLELETAVSIMESDNCE